MYTMDQEISSDQNRLRIDDIQAMLSTTFWSPGITKREILQGIRYSALVVGAYDPDGRQVGFCRVISDRTRFAYLLDVIVAGDRRHRGIGRAMVRYAVAHPDLKDVYQWLLKTSDAHGVYGKCGFVPVGTPEKWMEILHPRPDRRDW